METITKYLTVSHLDIKEFDKAIISRLQEGWKLQGGVSITWVEIPQIGTPPLKATQFAQAMVKEK